MAQQNPLTCKESVTGDPVKYYIPLAPFERHLISELKNFLNTKSEATALLPFENAEVESAFRDWAWTDRMRELEKEFEDEALEEYDGDRRRAYEESMSSKGRKEGGLELARVQRIKDENKTFIEKLGDKAFKGVIFCPVDEDLASWKTISRVYAYCGRRWKATTIWNLHGTFEIWKLIRMFEISWGNRGNEEALDLLLQHDQFLKTFDLEIDADGDYKGEDLDDELNRPFKFYSRPTGDIEQWPANLSKIAKDGNMNDDYFDYIMRQVGRRKEINDPRGYIHVISWTDLQYIEPGKLIMDGIDIEIPFLENGINVQWVLWSPPHPSALLKHQFFTEEEVFGYNILNDWVFPDHTLNGQIVFAIHELESTEFIPDLFQYWENWNDCAITQKSSESPVLLLETIPGLRFRSRLKNQDRTAARNYFRNLVEAHAAGTLKTSVIRTTLGPEGYSLQYEHSLRVIPSEQLSAFEWDRPLGRGENGAVYAAIWERPGSILTSSTSEGPVAVVLKDIVSRKEQKQGPTKKILKELDATFTSLAGSAVCCVKFFGIAVLEDGTHSKTKSKEKFGPQSENQGGPKIFLVFERATQGTLPAFLERHLRGVEFVECWDRTADALSSIAVGIKTLHQSHVLHRDLHLNNILVTDRYYHHDLELSHEYQYLLSDLGEGKVLRDEQKANDSTAHHASYGAIDPRAPEISGNHGWSTAAEVFSYGVIACKILDLRSYFSNSGPSDEILDELEREFPRVRRDPKIVELIVPVRIRKAVEPCLSQSPGSRPSIGTVVRALDQLLSNFTGDKMYPQDEKGVQWTCWDWNRSLREGRLGTAASCKDSQGEQVSDEFTEFENIS